MFKTLYENWKGRISLAHLHLLSTKTFFIKLLSVCFKTSSLFCQPRLTHKFVYLPFFCNQTWPFKKLISLFAGPLEKSPLMCWPVGKIIPHLPAQPVRKITSHRTGLGLGPCRPLALTYLSKQARAVMHTLNIIM